MSARRGLGDSLGAAARRTPIRWRLAGTSAALTFVILCGFALVVGELTTRRIHSDFDHQIAASADYLRDRLDMRVVAQGSGQVLQVEPNLDVFAGTGHAAIRVAGQDGTVLQQTRSAPDLGSPLEARTVERGGYRIENREVPLASGGEVYVQYARPLSDLQGTLSRVRLFLILGVLAGAALALLAGLWIARGAMAPITALTQAAREIALTRDPRRRVPQPEARDEVAELAVTLDGMLRSLDEARGETEGMLARQREFVADASHELRTPLTSVLANLELLEHSLRDPDQTEAAHSALRSSRRMRRLVEDLLLLARADLGQRAARGPVDLADVALEAAAELGPLAARHELTVQAEAAPVHGAHDELVRVALNLVDNALNHTPPGTSICLRTGTRDDRAVLAVSDDGPGVDPAMAGRLFERFARGSGDRGGSVGIGLAIVRAVATSHGGAVALVPSERGACFEVTLPARREPTPSSPAEPDRAEPLKTP